MNGRTAACAVFAFVLSVPANAADAIAPQPTTQDETQINAIVDATIASLKTKPIRQAIADYFRSNPIMAGKQQEVDMFGVQAEATIVAYGSIRSCQLTEKRSSSSWSQIRLYVCQHDNYLTRWIFDVIKTPKGWQAGNLRFDDKFSQGLGE